MKLVIIAILVIIGLALLVRRPPNTSAVIPEPQRRLSSESVSAEAAVAPIIETLQPSRRPSIKITLNPLGSDSTWRSKVGGLPYWPNSEPVPTDDEGATLTLLAQINFAELPANQQFPAQGILQFFIANDDLYGLNFDQQQQQSGFRVRYWAKPHRRVEQLLSSWPEPSGERYMPHDHRKPLAMSFSSQMELMSVVDTDVDGLLGDSPWNIAEQLSNQTGISEDAILEQLPDGAGHKLGGYPFFTQEDPREAGSSLQLLFQLDTDDHIMWGDAGVGNFFIADKALAARDFSQVLYNWDCH